MEIPPSQQLRKLAESAAYESGRQIRELQAKPFKISRKGFRDLVTDADFQSQEIITGLIRSQYPDHGFLTEEADNTLPENGHVLWIIDPVDGTTNYSLRHPNYSVAIAAARNSDIGLETASVDSGDESVQLELLAGAIYDPPHSEMFSGATGFGSTLNSRVNQVNETDDLAQAVVGFDWGRSFEQRERMLNVLNLLAHEVHTIRAVGSAAQALAWVACGRLDMYINFSIGPWDVAAAKIIIEEAGGLVSSDLGHSWTIDDTRCIASNKLLHDRILKLVQSV